MTSKIVVNNIESDAGVSTVFFNSDIGGTGGTLNVDGNLNVDGVLSYEDVTNIDSVGIITARDGIRVTSGEVGIDNATPHRKLVVGGGGDIACFGANGGIYFGTSTGGFRNNGAIARAQQAGYHVSGSQIGDLVMAPEADKDLIFSSGGSSTMYERLRITTGGNISVGGATGGDFSLLDGIVTNTANGSAGLLINSSSSSHNAYLGFSYGSGSSTSHADQFSAYIGRVGDNTLILGTDNNIRVRIDPSGHLLHGVSADEDTSGNGGLRFINSGDIQIDGDQKALVFRSTNNTAQLQSAIEWWNENGAGVQSKIACDRTAVSQAPSDLVFYTSPNVDSGGTSSDGDIAEHLRITSAGETLISNNANRFLSLDRTNATSGSGEFNLNVENTSQATVSYDDGAPLVIGTSSSPRTQAGFSEKVRISSEGYVTKANHPVFRVGRHTDYNHTALQPVQFNVTTGSAHINQGNHYSTSLHRFTAPVAGVYQFSACVIVNGLANPTDVTDLFYLMKNGGNVAYSMRRSRYVSNYTGTSGYYVDFMSNVNVLMAANDFCDIRVRLSLSVHGNATYTWFTGTLVG